MKGCRFCELNLEQNRILREGKFTKVIFSNPRLMPGHLLVIPKRHVVKIAELNKEEQKELFEITIEMQEKILRNISLGCDIRQNCRPFQEEDDLKVDHLHIHLIPRELFDNLYEKCQIHEKDVFERVSVEELIKSKEKLK